MANNSRGKAEVRSSKTYTADNSPVASSNTSPSRLKKAAFAVAFAVAFDASKNPLTVDPAATVVF